MSSRTTRDKMGRPLHIINLVCFLRTRLGQVRVSVGRSIWCTLHRCVDCSQHLWIFIFKALSGEVNWGDKSELYHILSSSAMTFLHSERQKSFCSWRIRLKNKKISDLLIGKLRQSWLSHPSYPFCGPIYTARQLLLCSLTQLISPNCWLQLRFQARQLFNSIF